MVFDSSSWVVGFEISEPGFQDLILDYALTNDLKILNNAAHVGLINNNNFSMTPIMCNIYFQFTLSVLIQSR